jgi:pimeloyl-ACP methyl ester carboxylesterase
VPHQVVDVSDTRSVSVDCWGAPDGTPIFLLHGTPGSRRGPRPRTSVLYRLGVRLVCYDRPGYGGSSRHFGRTVADAARDVQAIADRLGIERFGVVGRSGGGPHALACAVTLGDRVTSAAILVSLAPSDAEGLDWYDGMAKSNVEDFGKADNDAAAVQAELADLAQRVRNDPESLLEHLLPELSRTDLRVVDDVVIRRLLTDTYAEALREGPDGWIDDVLALRRPWGLDLAAIRAPVLLWHGADDTFSPVTHAYWLAKQIPTAAIKVESNAAHFSAVEILPSILAWIKENSGSEGLRVKRMHQPVFSA